MKPPNAANQCIRIFMQRQIRGTEEEKYNRNSANIISDLRRLPVAYCPRYSEKSTQHIHGSLS
ncbi:hypothetical protein T05_364 [Trichinella murrelli]|uniref:Uncharacterized protein n=1 Tax=Trichinella murrelli TaxID=144512 RepID=A0A0V0T332_9BILA|nr:hypothetical protein T05_364 [Trichinella murrelli]